MVDGAGPELNPLSEVGCEEVFLSVPCLGSSLVSKKIWETRANGLTRSKLHPLILIGWHCVDSSQTQTVLMEMFFSAA
ncbi:hypothetical protein LDENG_00115500 [Lucifuga dentata]|nr:hypothetical protein LDENG_00115500 [Lucifuga dentata]